MAVYIESSGLPTMNRPDIVYLIVGGVEELAPVIDVADTTFVPIQLIFDHSNFG